MSVRVKINEQLREIFMPNNPSKIKHVEDLREPRNALMSTVVEIKIIECGGPPDFSKETILALGCETEATADAIQNILCTWRKGNQTRRAVLRLGEKDGMPNFAVGLE